MDQHKSLGDILKRNANNFDILRLTAALAVIIGHAYAIAPQPPLQDGILTLTKIDFSGAMAVKFFFFLSGVLVTNSIISNPDPFHFLLKRACRIFPGLLVCLLVTVLVVGPLFTTLPLKEYFIASDTWKYLRHNFFLHDIVWRLPGVFESSDVGINGSLWTLPFEALCYVYLAVLYGSGLLKNKIVFNAVFLVLICVALLSPAYLPPYFAANPGSQPLVACFSTGALYAFNKDWIRIHVYYVILAWLFVYLLDKSPVYPFLFYGALFYTSLFAASRDFVVRRLHLPFDASYGIYVYGYVIQQCVRHVLPDIGVHGNQLVSCLIAVPVGIASWYLVEKPFISFGNRAAKTSWGLFFYETWLKIRRWSASICGRIRSFAGDSVLSVFFFLLLAWVMHFVVLSWIFPGYYQPFYSPFPGLFRAAAFAHSTLPIAPELLKSHPAGYFFERLTGYFGIRGSVACVILVICLNGALTALLLKKALRIPWSWILVLAFLLYCYLMFSQPYFYVYYLEDDASHFSYLLLIVGAHLFYRQADRRGVLANLSLFIFCMTGFLCEQTYAVAAIVCAAGWWIYHKKVAQPVGTADKMLWPPAVVILALVLDLLIERPVLAQNNVWKSCIQYLSESMNMANLLMVILLGWVLLRKNADWQLRLAAISCFLGGLLCWVPHALFAGHMTGYSFESSYLVYAPLILLPALYPHGARPGGFFKAQPGARTKWLANAWPIAIFLLGSCSPLFNITRYKENDSLISREERQRNLVESMDQLTATIPTTGVRRKILIRQDSPVSAETVLFPAVLQAFPLTRYADIAVEPADPTGRYDLIWTIDQQGKLKLTEDPAVERIFMHPADSNQIIHIDQHDIPRYTTSGFYDPESGARWTNGRASIELGVVHRDGDSLRIKLSTSMPDKCKEIEPRVTLSDGENRKFDPVLTERKGDIFYYLFVLKKENDVRAVHIWSGTIDASPDVRTLSFPFKSIEISGGHI
jgi:peptidoglycan/LPS O-acetylase OafA/YrhL